MPLFGTEFNNILDLKTDQAYTGYFTTAKKNRFVQEAITKAVELKVATNDRIQVQDDLFGIFKTNSVFTPTTNTLDLIIGGAAMTDYHHVMNVKAKYVVAFTGITISTATATTPLRITLTDEVNLRNGEAVQISGVNAQANGTRYVKRLRNDLFELYSDARLTTPIVGVTAFTGAGNISRIIYNDAYDMKSNRKFSNLNAPTVYDPYYEIANTVMKIYPIDQVCSEITMDYVSVPVYIDVTNNTTDLLGIYSLRFIYFIADETARLMAMSMRDDNLMMQTQSEITNQP
jgi:hypothetical protein